MHPGSRNGRIYEDIADLEPDAAVLDGLTVSGDMKGYRDIVYILLEDLPAYRHG